MKKILTIRFAFSRPSSPVSSDQLALLECEIDRGMSFVRLDVWTTRTANELNEVHAEAPVGRYRIPVQSSAVFQRRPWNSDLVWVGEGSKRQD